jgi:hypothetical protein
MKGKRKRLIAAVAVIGVLAAGGAAFTNALDVGHVSNATAGYGSISVNGTDRLDSVVYGFNSDGSQIMTVHLTFHAALANKYVAVAFNDSANNLNGAGGSALTTLDESTCTDPDNAGAAKINSVHADCTIDTGNSNGADTNAAQNLNVLVKDNQINQ